MWTASKSHAVAVQTAAVVALEATVKRPHRELAHFGELHPVRAALSGQDSRYVKSPNIKNKHQPTPKIMTQPLGKTIQIFLPDGNPRGVKVAEFTSRTIQAVLLPRAQLDFACTRGEL